MGYNKTDYYKKLSFRLYSKTISKINKNYEKECLCFTGSKYGNGYGQIKVFGKNKAAHRISYALFHNLSIEDLYQNLDICHGKDCDNSCIEPTHLELKTKSENNFEDKIRDGTLIRGEKHHRASISEELALQIKKSRNNFTTQKERANHFNISLSIIKDIDSNNTWVHLPDKNGNIINNFNKRIKKRISYKNKKKLILNQQQYEQIFLKIKNKTSLSLEINKNVKTKCWIYTGTIVNGYGVISFNGIKFKTHILMYDSINGKNLTDKNKTVVRHLCNTKSCCNPEHLLLGTHSENMIDAVKNNSKVAKLDENKIKEIKILLNENILTQKEIAIKFNVTPATISRIKNKKIWSFVE